jgi:hypothetical protein
MAEDQACTSDKVGTHPAKQAKGEDLLLDSLTKIELCCEHQSGGN